LSQRRITLRSSEVKELAQKIAEVAPQYEEYVSQHVQIEVVRELGDNELYYVNGKPFVIRHGAKFYPSLKALDWLKIQYPKAVVDMGAVPFVAKGADVMAPGIRRVEKEFNQGDTVIVSEEKYGKNLAVTEAIMTSVEIMQLRRGKALFNVHYVGDRVWKALTASE
jgi:PUA-domain protein